MDEQNFTLGDVKDYLLQKKINPSYQRLKILEHLMNSESHPTVDMIYRTLSEEIPTLSKTTIYNTLDLFIKKGLINGLTIEENEVRYDANTAPHAHFKCTMCGKVFDIPVDFPLQVETTVCEHVVKEKHFYLKGICKNCASRSA
jgi:Fur family peroxide stress response transcriptional regulator